MCVLLFNLRHVIQIPSFRIVNLLCCGGHFSSIAVIELRLSTEVLVLDVSQPYL